MHVDRFIGPGPIASRNRYILASIAFSSIYLAAQLLQDVAFPALTLGYLGVLVVGAWWWFNERQRGQIARQFEKNDPDKLPDLRVFALVVVLQLVVIFPQLFWAAQHSFKLYDVPQYAPWYSWVIFTFDSFCKSLFDWSEIYEIHFTAIEFRQDAPWGRHLAFLKRLTIDFVFLAAIWRTIAIYVDIKSAIQSLSHTPNPSIHVGKRAGRKLIAALLHDDTSLDENVRCKKRSNAAYALGQIGYGNAVVHLCKILSDTNVDRRIRTAAARALGDIGDVRAGETLCRVLEGSAESEWRLSVVIARSLEQIKPLGAVGPLCELLELGDRAGTQARRRSAELLGDLGDSSAIETLCRAVENDSDVPVRLRAIRAIEKLCQKDEQAATLAFYALVRVSEDDATTEDVRSEARRVLRVLQELHPNISGESSHET